jgi:hypothetical protein
MVVRCRYPHIEIDGSELDGNPLAVVGAVAAAPREGGVPGEEVVGYQQAALFGNYDHVLRVSRLGFPAVVQA